MHVLLQEKPVEGTNKVWNKVQNRIGLRTFNNNPGALTTIGLDAAREEAYSQSHRGKEVTLLGLLGCKADSFTSVLRLLPEQRPPFCRSETPATNGVSNIPHRTYCRGPRALHAQTRARFDTFQGKSMLMRRACGLLMLTSDMSLIIPMTCRADQADQANCSGGVC